MVRKFYFVAVTILGLAFSSCTNDVSEDIMADAFGTLSNTEAEIVELKSGFTITKKDGVYSMGDILLSEEQVKLLDETGSIYPVQATEVPSDSIMVSPIAGTKVVYPTNSTRAVGRHPNENVFWTMVRYQRNNIYRYISVL